jgi:succinate-semialdehyde dehydrogenase/glutarate-semialdehyde dehydrogenase
VSDGVIYLELVLLPCFFEAPILMDVKKGTPAYDEELFGPVAAVMVVHDEDTGTAVPAIPSTGSAARSTPATSSGGGGSRIRLTPGMVFGKHPAWMDMPFGGIKKSGYGRKAGPLGIQEFVNKKLVRVPETVHKKF